MYYDYYTMLYHHMFSYDVLNHTSESNIFFKINNDFLDIIKVIS